MKLFALFIGLLMLGGLVFALQPIPSSVKPVPCMNCIRVTPAPVQPIQPIPCSSCGSKREAPVSTIIYNSPNLCWSFYSLETLWGKSPFLESLCSKFKYQPQCASTEVRAAASGLPLCASNKLQCGIECMNLRR